MMKSEEIRLRGERDKMAKLRAAREAAGIATPHRHSVETDSAQRTGNTETQCERVLTIIRDHGPCTDWDVARIFKDTYGFDLDTHRVHARRNDLMDQDLVGDTGRKVLNEATGMHVTLWGLTRDIPEAQRRINIYKRTSYRKALDFAFSQDSDYKSMCFLRAWYAESWDELSANWPSFIAKAQH